MKSSRNIIVLKNMLIGTILPLIIGYLIKLWFYDYIKVSDMISNPELMNPFLQWGIIANMLLFGIYMFRNKLNELRGLIVPTLVYVVIVMVIKFF